MATSYYETLVEEDLDLGTSTVTKRAPGGGAQTGTQINLATFSRGGAKVTTTWDAGSISAGSFEAKDVTVTGATLGDFAMASLNIDVQDMQLDANVTAADTVTVTLTNLTGSAVDLASATLAVVVFNVA